MLVSGFWRIFARSFLENFFSDHCHINNRAYGLLKEKIVDYIKTDLVNELRDDLTCINGIGGKRDKQVGMIEFINLFSNLNLKIEDFIIKKENKVEINYIWEVMFVWKKHKCEYLSDFFGDFIWENAEKILNEIIKFINKKGDLDV